MKTYLVPVSEEVIKAMEKGEAPSFLHCATCLDGLTNGEVIQKMFPGAKFCCTERLQTAGLPRRDADFDLDFWNAKWGE